jgi:hypothetical protein
MSGGFFGVRNRGGGAFNPRCQEHAERIFEEYEREQERKIMDKNNPILRCKVRVAEVSHLKNADGSTSQEKITLSAVYSNDPNSENKQWSTWTPFAHFQLGINNPQAFGKLSSGHEFYVDFTPVASESVEETE